jgi:hypothetical protein
MPFVPTFRPSQNAPLFHNGPWPQGTNLSVSIMGLPSVSIDTTQMGLCGGMSFLARDIFESGTPQLRQTDASTIPLQLAQHILARLVDSFDGPATVHQWIAATQAQDHDTLVWGAGLFHRTVAECPAIMSDIDAGILCPIGVVLVQSMAPWDVFQNHAELVWGYERFGDMLRLHTYDCNAEGRDDIVIELDISSLTPAKPITTNGTAGPTAGHIRGFFRLPYTHVDPSPAYIPTAWSHYVQLGSNQISAGPAACSGGPNRIDVFVRGTDNRLYTKSWNGDGWTDYRQLGTEEFLDNPAAVSWGPNRIDVFDRGTDNRLYTKSWHD